jgi:hypothetical protein
MQGEFVVDVGECGFDALTDRDRLVAGADEL